MTDVQASGTISLTTMRVWKNELEQLGAKGDLELLRQVADQRMRQELGDPTNLLTPQQVGTIEGFTGIKAEYE